MQKNKLGNTDIMVSQLGFGASPFGNIYNQHVTDQEAKKMVDYALDQGINYFDVAPYYGLGEAEVRLGKALPAVTTDLVISTKVGRYGEKEFDFSAKKITTSLELSLQRLNREYLDIIFCHDIEFVDKSIIIQEALPTLAALKKAGKIKAIGISGFPLDQLEALAQTTPIDVVLSYCHYTYINQDLASSWLASQAKKGELGLINASPFAMGLLTQSNCPPWHPFDTNVKQYVEELKKTLNKQGKSIEQTAFSYAIAADMVSSTLTGFSSLKQLTQCLQWNQQTIN